jgi:hypothetical protein
MRKIRDYYKITQAQKQIVQSHEISIVLRIQGQYIRFDWRRKVQGEQNDTHCSVPIVRTSYLEDWGVLNITLDV